MNVNKDVLDPGPFFHGTKAVLNVGDLLEPDYQSNFQDKKSNYIYFTATLEAAKWGAELAAAKNKERIYIIEPSGEFENDPNLTDKRFPAIRHVHTVHCPLLKSSLSLEPGKDIQMIR